MNIGLLLKYSVVICCVLFLFIPPALAQQTSYHPVFSTYFGASGNDLIYDVTSDSQGNIIVTGMTDSTDFPFTVGPSYHSPPCGTVQDNFPDAFVSKFSSNGKLLWSRLLGGPCYDEGYSVKTDSSGNIYVAGIAGIDFPTTAGVIQQTLQVNENNSWQGGTNGFITKLNPNGEIVWSTYYGGADSTHISSIALDSHNDIYGIIDEVTEPFPYITPDAADITPGGNGDVVVFKISTDGSKSKFATYVAGTGYDGFYSSIAVGPDDSIYIAIETGSNDIPITQNALQSTLHGYDDIYIAQLNPEGTHLLYATYLGGSSSESSQIHALVVDKQGNIYVTGDTNSPDFPTTSGAMLRAQPYPPSSTIFVSKISPDGSLAASTFLGVKSVGNIPIIRLTPNGSPVIFSAAEDWQTPLSPVMPQLPTGNSDVVYVPLSPDLSSASPGGYYGGSSFDYAGMGTISQDGSITLTAVTGSIDVPTFNAYHPEATHGQFESIIAHIAPDTISPTPTGPPGCPRKSQGDADCQADTSGKSINLLDYAIWYLEFINKCSSTNLGGCGPDSDGDGNPMDANFNYPGTNYIATDNKVDTFDYAVWIQGFVAH